MTVFTAVSQEEFLGAVRQLAVALSADVGWAPDMLVGIGRGGLVPAVFLSHATGTPMVSVDRSSGFAEFAEAPLVALARRTRDGERLLFVDDINDSGLTIGRLRAAIGQVGAVEDGIRFATLIDNRGSTQRVDYAARVIDRATTKDWFVFPWEAAAPDSSHVADAGVVPGRIA